jgi:hypothetical protein
MDVEQALYERLKAQVTTVQNRVAAAPAPDSWPVPLVTYQLIGGAPMVTAGGVQRWWQPTFQVTVWAATYESMMAVVAQVRAALQGWGAVFNPGGLTVEYSWIESQVDLQDKTLDPPLIGRAFDVIVSCEGGG